MTPYTENFTGSHLRTWRKVHSRSEKQELGGLIKTLATGRQWPPFSAEIGQGFSMLLQCLPGWGLSVLTLFGSNP